MQQLSIACILYIANNDKYLGMNHEGDIVALYEKSGDVCVTLRSLNKREEKSSKKDLPEEERVDDLVNVELNYVKKFQKFQDKRIRMSKEDAGELAKAKEVGTLHEKLLDRREKMKADRYCKWTCRDKKSIMYIHTHTHTHTQILLNISFLLL